MTEARHFVFAGGGSGGHLTPSIAVSEQLLELTPDCSVSFLTSGREIDQVVLGHSSLANDGRCEIVVLPVTESPRLDVSAFRHLQALGRSVRQCRHLLQRRSANVVMGTGAFASLPGLIAARYLKIPIVLFEANAAPGRVNRWWSKYATARFSGWMTDDQATSHKFEFVGMPTTSGQETVLTGTTGDSNTQQLLIVGGSQGSQRLNELVVSAITQTGLPANWHILHQTGSGKLPTPWPRNLSDRVRITDFIADLPQQISDSTVVISRAGAVTISEITTAGRPCVLVPLRNTAEDHQQINAKRIANAGASAIVDEHSPHAIDELVSALQSLLNDEDARSRMQRQSQTLQRPGAARLIARRLLELAEQCETP